MRTGPLYDEMRTLETEIKTAKKALRTWRPGDGPLAVGQWQVMKLGKRATVIYATIAHARGRVHRQGSSLEQQAAFLARSTPTPVAEPKKVEVAPRGLLARLLG